MNRNEDDYLAHDNHRKFNFLPRLQFLSVVDKSADSVASNWTRNRRPARVVLLRDDRTITVLDRPRGRRRMKVLFSISLGFGSILYVVYAMHLFRIGYPQPLLLHVLFAATVFGIIYIERKRNPEHR